MSLDKSFSSLSKSPTGSTSARSDAACKNGKTVPRTGQGQENHTPSQPRRAPSRDILPPTALAQVGLAGQLPVGESSRAHGAFYSAEAVLPSAGAAKGAAVRLEAPTHIEIAAARQAFAIRNPEILRRIEGAVGYLMARNINPANKPKAASKEKVRRYGPGPLVRRVAARLIEDKAEGRLLSSKAMQAALGVSPSTLLAATKLAGVALPNARNLTNRTDGRQKRLDALAGEYSGAGYDRQAFADRWGVKKATVAFDISDLRRAGRLPAYADEKETE